MSEGKNANKWIKTNVRLLQLSPPAYFQKGAIYLLFVGMMVLGRETHESKISFLTLNQNQTKGQD